MRASLCFWLAASCFGGTAWASPALDVIVLDTGAILRGTLLERDAGGVQFSTGAHSTYRIPWSKIACVQQPERLAQNEAAAKASDAPAVSPQPAPPPPLPAALTAGKAIDTPPSLVHVGAMLGLSASDVSLSPEYSTTNRTGLVAGAFVEIRLLPKLFLEPEVYYAQLGYQLVASDVAQQFYFDVVKVPLLLKWKVEAGRSDVRIHFVLGPSVGGRVSSSEIPGDTGPFYRSALVAIDFGAGVEYTLTPRVSLRFDARYSLGLNDVSRVTAEAIKTVDQQMFFGVSYAL